MWAAVVAAALVVSMAGCQPQAEEPPTLTPTVEPPVITQAGVLKVGVDLSYPPFAGTIDGTSVGIDVDIAAAIAERLGLTVELVDVKPSQMSTALAGSSIDVMLGAVPITDAVLADAATAGTYLINGIAIFTTVPEGSVAATVTPEQLATLRVGAQQGSAAFWALESEMGEGFVRPFDTLKGAFDAMNAGEVDVVVGDAVVGAYIARDYPAVAFAGQMGDPQPLGAVVRKDAIELEAAVRSTLDAMAADGVLATIRGKWLGSLPELASADAPTS